MIHIYFIVVLLLMFFPLLKGCVSQKSSASTTTNNVTYKTKSDKLVYLFNALTCKCVENCYPQEITDVFLITDTIYLYLTWQDLKKENKIIIYWYTPGGKLQDQTIHTFQYHSGFYNTWHYLQLFDNQVRLEEFVGHWTAKIVLNNDFVGEKKFSVSYP